MGIKRISVNIPHELADELDKLKQERFNNKSTAEMIRFLIESGLEQK